MSRISFAASILFATLCLDAGATVIDLDRPGALQALERERPDHHKRVMEEISKAQTIHVDPEPTLQKARPGVLDPRQGGGANLLTSDPAKKRLTVFVDDVTYRVTAHMTKHPARIDKAR